MTTVGGFRLNDTWDWGWDGTLTSDKTFLDKYDFDERDLATSKLYLTGMDDRNYFSAQALHFRTLSLDEDQSTISRSPCPTSIRNIHWTRPCLAAN